MILEICKKAQAASVQLAKLSTEEKNAAVCKMAEALEAKLLNSLIQWAR